MGNESDSSNVSNRAWGLAVKALLLTGGALLVKRLSRSTTRWDHARFVTNSLSGEKEAAMSAPIPPAFLFLLVLLLIRPPTSTALKARADDPVPADWPHQFHSLLFMNMSDGTLQKIDLWYDWPNGRNFNIIQNQLGDVVKYDLEWNNGTSFIYTLDPSEPDCQVLHVEVGILRPNWLDGANYLGQDMVDNFLCNVWEKVEFIWYYEDVLTKRPVKWIFYSGYTAHVMTFEVGAVLDDPNWQAPVYCFSDNEKERKSSRLELGGSFGRLMRGMANAAAHDM